MSRDPLIISGGNAIVFGASLILDLRKRSIGEGDPITRDIGIKVGLTVKKNHCVPTKNPYVKADYYAIFGEGIEQFLEVMENAVAQGILVKAGAFIKDVDENGDPKFLGDTKLVWQGKENFRNFMKENPDYFDELKRRVNGEVVQMTEEEVQNALAEENEIQSSVAEETKKEIKKTTKPKAKKKA